MLFGVLSPAHVILQLCSAENDVPQMDKKLMRTFLYSFLSRTKELHNTVTNRYTLSPTRLIGCRYQHAHTHDCCKLSVSIQAQTNQHHSGVQMSIAPSAMVVEYEWFTAVFH